MRIVTLVFALCLVLSVGSAVCGQNWNAGSSSGCLIVQWSLLGDEYTFVVSVAQDLPAGDPVLAWTLEPFNIVEPVDVVCPDGWEWSDQGGWSKFQLQSNSEKYDFNGPALEPGEELEFKYTIGESDVLVNSGGPGGEAPAFLAHVSAIDGVKRGKWMAVGGPYGETWYDIPEVTDAAPSVPELPSSAVLVMSIFASACLTSRRARV